MSIETASTWKPVLEAFWMSESWRKANLRYYPYVGRGYIQLTWASNYLAAGNALGVDLTGSPDLAMEPDVAARVFAWFWDGHGLAALADARNWREVRRRVQGGDAGLPRLIQIAGDLLG